MTTTELEIVIKRLEEDIVFGRRRPRERLIEDELVAQFGAKKHIIRQALFELERMGLIERKRNKGAVVRDYMPDEVRQIFAVRKLLEAEAARQILLPASEELIEELSAIHRAHSEAVEHGEITSAFRANIRFHQTLFGACDNPYLVEAISLFAFKTHGVRFYSLVRPEYLQNARRDHEAMIEALRDGDRKRLIALCTEHLELPVKAYNEAYEQTFGAVLKRSA